MHKRNCFLTLTYGQEHCPADYGLHYPDFQKFMKRLRRKLGPCRFYMCGEYGDEGQRPHFHACLFGIDFDDGVVIRRGKGFVLRQSLVLDRLWGKGFASIGEVNFETAAYVARYIMAKQTGKGAEAHYEIVDPQSGEIFSRTPEFTHMSLKPGIGASWFDRYQGDVFPWGTVVTRGREGRAPRFYDRRLKVLDPDAYEDLLMLRSEQVAAIVDLTPERMQVKAQVMRAKLAQGARRHSQKGI